MRCAQWLRPELRLSVGDQQSLVPYARMVRYGADEIVQYAGLVPTGMTFLSPAACG